MNKPEPPLSFRGIFAEAIYERIIDHTLCHCCGGEIHKNTQWGCLGDAVRRDRRGAQVRFIRLCETCFRVPHDAMQKMEWGWE